MKRIFLLSILSIMFCWSSASANVINFDDLALGDYGDSLHCGDVTINTYPGAHLQVTDQSADGFGNAYSLSNKLSVWGNQPLVPKEKTSFLVLFDIPVQQVSFWLTGTWHDTAITAWDEDGNALASFWELYPRDGLSPDGTSWDYYYDRALRSVSIDVFGVSKFLVQPVNYDGFSIDDLSYTPVSAVPEPATMLLLPLGLAGFRFFRRKR